MLKFQFKEYFFADLCANRQSEGNLFKHKKGEKLEVIEESRDKHITMYIRGLRGAKAYLDEDTVRYLLHFKKRGIYYDFYYVTCPTPGLVKILICCANGIIRPEQILY